MAKGQGIILGVVGGVIVVAVIVASSIAKAKPAEVQKPAAKKPTKVKPSSSSTTTPEVTPGKENTAAALTTAETLSLANDSQDLLFAWAMVSPHKPYVTAISQKLATAGDTRAQYVTQRLGMWSGGVTYANLIAPDSDIVAHPENYTLDQISDAGGVSDATNFKQWAAEFLKANQRPEQAQIILDQITASKVAGNA